MASRTVDVKIKRLERRVKRLEDVMEISPMLTTFDWEEFNIRDKAILKILLEKGRRGVTTTVIATELDFPEPEKTGRVIVYRRLKRMERISKRIKGFPIISCDRKKWSLNYDEFKFDIDVEKQKVEAKKK